jgi:hypothetical protein
MLAIDTPKDLLVLIANRARFWRSRCVLLLSNHASAALDLILERELRCLLGRLGGIALPSGRHADSPQVLLQADPILISFSCSVVSVQVCSGRGSASSRKKLARL